MLGISTYLQYLFRLFVCIPGIVRSGDFRSLDQSMGAIAKVFRYRNNKFYFDCEFCDAQLDEDSFGFGIVREIYVRDCYFRWHPPSVYENAKVVVDLGANRGAFSSLMTTTAKFVLSVECGKQYSHIIEHNFSRNGFSTFSIENLFVGTGGTTESASSHITMNDLLDRYGLDEVDFLKMDIEGSEFSLFETADWLKRIRALSMEVHVNEGNPESILESLRAYGFSYKVTDEDLVPTDDLSVAGFIYAWRE